jgi:hypothetical protein
LCCEFATQALRLDVVDERALAVDLDDGDPLAVGGLELRDAADVDLLEVGALCLQDRSRTVTEMAPAGRVEPDPYG